MPVHQLGESYRFPVKLVRMIKMSGPRIDSLRDLTENALPSFPGNAAQDTSL